MNDNTPSENIKTSVETNERFAFILKFIGKTVKITPSNGQPVTGTLEGFNNYEILVETRGQKRIIFKHSIYFIEELDQCNPQRARPERRS